jgi:hypothetical protein
MKPHGFFDEYELKARIAPGLLTALPVIVFAFYAAPDLWRWPMFAASGAVTLALIYGLGQFAKSRGEAIEKALWQSWDGPPSTRYMRHRDMTFGPELKALIAQAIHKEFSMTVFAPEQENESGAAADQCIADAFRRVKQFLRENDARGLWFTHNIEYGFWRNLRGCRRIWVVLSVVAMILSVYVGRIRGGLVNPGSVIAAACLVCALYLGWFVQPGAVKQVADGYAELAWMSFLSHAGRSKRLLVKKQASGS